MEGDEAEVRRLAAADLLQQTAATSGGDYFEGQQPESGEET